MTAAAQPVIIGDRKARADEAAAFAVVGKPSPSAITEPLPIVWADKVADVDVPSQLIERLLTRGSVAGIIGPSGSAKTHVAVHAACCVGRGADFLGRRTRKGLVLYLAAESPTSVRHRMRAYLEHGALDELPVAITECPIDLLNPAADAERVIATIGETQKQTGDRFVLIIVDTLARTFGGGDENLAADMGAFVGNLTYIAFLTGAVVLVVHHQGKDGAKGPRGSSALFAALDTVLEVSNSDGIVTLKVAKQRDLPIGDEFTAKLVPVPLGVDEWGNEYTACVLEEVGQRHAPARPRRLPKGSELAFSALKTAIDEHGDRMPATTAIPPGVRAVTGQLWRSRYNALDSIDVDERDGKAADKAREARQKRFTRARQALQGENMVGAANDFFWVNP